MLPRGSMHTLSLAYLSYFALFFVSLQASARMLHQLAIISGFHLTSAHMLPRGSMCTLSLLFLPYLEVFPWFLS